MAQQVNYGIQQYSGFDPRSIVGCALWLDAADSNAFTFSSGSTLATWRDKSSNAYTGTAVGSPTRVASSINSLPAVTFNGSTQYVNFGNVVNVGTSNLYVFTACQFNSTANGTIVGKTSQRGFAGRWAMYRLSGDGGMVMMVDPAGSGFVSAFADTSTSARILTGYWDRSTIYTIENGTQRATRAVASTASLSNTDPLWVGAYPNSTGTTPPATGLYFNGRIGEIIVYLGTLTTFERQQVEGYLAWKWGINGSFSTGHPYKPYPPALRLFTPYDISNGPEYWFDAADSNTITATGTTLTTWSNKGSVVGSNATTASGTVTTGSVTQQNGLNVIGMGSGYANATMAFPIQARTRFFAARPTVNQTATISIFLAQTGVATGRDWITLDQPSQGGRPDELAQGVAYNIVTTNQLPNQSNVFAAYTFRNAATAANNRIAYNGSNMALTTSNVASGYLTTAVATQLGSNIDMGEWISFNTELTSNQTLQLEGYLAWKWGLQASFPTTHPFYKFPPSTPVFVPTAISGCRLWLDAADSNTVTLNGSSKVTAWSDKSGNNYTMTYHSTFSNGTVSSAYQNGLNVLNFSGSNVYKAPSGSACYPLDCYIVIALKSPLTRCDVISQNPGVATDNFNSLTFGEHTSLRWHNGSTNFFRTPNTVSPTNETSSNFLIMNWSLANNNYVIRRNGVQLSQTASYTFTLTANSIFQLGWRQSTAFGTPDVVLSAYIAEVVIYNTQLGSNDRQKVEGYLAWKWGLRHSLPTTHPYYKFRP